MDSPRSAVHDSGPDEQPMTSTSLACRLACLATFTLTPLPAAALEALGNEFRPTTEQLSSLARCTDANGVRAGLYYRCPLGEAADGSCIGDPYTRHVTVEGHDSGGELVAGPHVIADYYGWHPYGCTSDGAVMATADSKVFVIGREGPRGSPVPICQVECSIGRIAISGAADRFLVVWTEPGSEVLARFFAADGSPVSDQFVVNSPSPETYADALAASPGEDGDVVVAWVTNGWPNRDASVRVTLVHADGTSEPDVVLNQFVHGPFLAAVVIPEDTGRFVVAWENFDSQAGWVARRIALAGGLPTTTTTTTTTTLDEAVPAFLPASTLELTTSTDVEWPFVPPILAAGRTGHWIAAWSDLFDRVWPNKKVFRNFVQTSRDDARRWSATGSVSDDDWNTSVPSAAAMDDGGTAVMTWAGDTDHSIRYRRSEDGGQTWSATASIHEIVVETEGWEQRDRTITAIAVAAGSNGRWVAAWMEYLWEEVLHEDYYSLDVVACAVRTSVSTDGALTWQEPQTVDVAACDEWNEMNGDRGVDLATDGAGNWLLAWITVAFTASRSDDDGDSWSLPTTPFDVVGEQPRSIDLDASADGHWVAALEAAHPAVTWPHDQSRIYVTTSANLAEAWSPIVGLEPWHDDDGGSDTAPSIAAGDNGEWGIAWQSHEDVGGSGLDADIVAVFSANHGSTWSSPRLVDPESIGDSRTDLTPQLARSGETWAVLWRTLEPPDIYNTPWKSSVRLARTTGTCGNNEIDAGEGCDDGNLASGDGCDLTCVPTGCGSGVVTAGEECDDGNDDDSDGCLSSCRLPWCGDGAALKGVEECDDGNSIDTDACNSDCTHARCGDGNLHAGVEECDTGAGRSNTGACLLSCTLARCGDDLLHAGVEECDDGNVKNGDRCTKQCDLDPVCGPGPRVTTADALKVLRKAVGMAVYCPIKRCDTNKDRLVTTTDALQTLRFAVGLDLVDPCGQTRTLVVRLLTNEKPTALQFVLDYLDAPGDIVGSGSNPACTTVEGPGTLSSFRLEQGRGFLVAGFVDLAGFQGPVDIVRCEYRSLPDTGATGLTFTEMYVWDSSGVEITPTPTIAVLVE
jgi:cysteine-rich repeat protein